jgi:hypothetical protein
MNTKQFDVISPDGFSIHPSDVYPTKKKAIKAFEDWKKRYEIQGYYSSMNYGRIPLEDLHNYIEIKPINN